MNTDIEQHQLSLLPQQQQQSYTQKYNQKQQQQTTSMALMSSGEYVNFKSVPTVINEIASSSSPSTTSSIAIGVGVVDANNTTTMTIPLNLPILPLTTTTTFNNTITTTATTDMPYETMGVMTSSFKTPLLPMPTLEDIEQQQQYTTETIKTTDSSSMPYILPGILKYPVTTTAAAIDTNELNLPLGLISTDPISTATGANSTAAAFSSFPVNCNTATATIGGSRHKYITSPLTTPTIITPTSTSTSTSIITDMNNRSCATEIPINDIFINRAAAAAATTTTKMSNMHMNKGASAAKSRQQNSRGCCCACFRSQRPDGLSAASTTSSLDTHEKARRKQKTQTLWSAFITNVGICALLLAYTFLGEYPSI